MITGNGFIKREGHVTPEKARIFETRQSGMEFAVLDDGLILFPTAYEWEEVYEVESDDDVVEVESLLRAKFAADAKLAT